MDQSVIIQIEKLLLKKQLNRSNETEERELEELLEQYPEAKALQAAFEADLSAGRLTPLHHSNDPLLTLMELQDKVRSRKRRVTLGRFAAAASLLLLAGTAIFFWQARPQQTTVASLPAVKLKLANGRYIVLNEAEQQVILSGKATANNRTMTLPSEQHTPNADWNTLHVPKKLEYSITLADGSTVRMNAGSKLRFPFSFPGKTREVYIDGEAYFTIAKSANKPFIVHTPDGDIQVLGTEFNVNSYTKGITRTSLVDGAIAFKRGKDSIRLQPGTEVIATDKHLQTNSFESQVTLSWMNGIFFFHKAPLEEIAAMINRWFDVPVVIDDESLAKELFTGNLDKSKPLENFLELLKNTVDARWHYTGETLHITR